jgi:tRNA U38,U39,U40 pseudouridine synthase TruA
MFIPDLRKLAALAFAACAGLVQAGAYDDFFAATLRNDAATVSQLIQRGVDANSRDPQGQTALYLALRNGAFKVADALLAEGTLDVDAVNAASVALLGEHDFAAFCKRREGATTIRTLLDLHWARDEAGLVVAEVRADAFCHHMVRALTGCLVVVGERRRPPTWPAEVLAHAVRDPAVTVLPPRGLTLEEVGYPPDDQLATRAREARSRRDPG